MFAGITHIAFNGFLFLFDLFFIVGFVSLHETYVFAGDGFRAIAFVLMSWQFILGFYLFVQFDVFRAMFGFILSALASALLTVALWVLYLRSASASGPVYVIHDVFLILRVFF
jgi:hypothetical protein